MKDKRKKMNKLVKKNMEAIVLMKKIVKNGMMMVTMKMKTMEVLILRKKEVEIE